MVDEVIHMFGPNSEKKVYHLPFFFSVLPDTRLLVEGFLGDLEDVVPAIFLEVSRMGMNFDVDWTSHDMQFARGWICFAARSRKFSGRGYIDLDIGVLDFEPFLPVICYSAEVQRIINEVAAWRPRVLEPRDQRLLD